MMTNGKLTFELEGSRFAVSLFDKAAPKATCALRARLPLDGQIVNAMWSGPVMLINDLDLGGAPLENPITFLAAGDIVYHPAHHQIGIAYAPTQFREPIGPVWVTFLGQVQHNIDDLIEIGRNLQQTGAKHLYFR